MTRPLRPLLVLLALAGACTPTFAQELERPAPPATATIFEDGDPAAARARYQRAIELFPHTHWAQVARQRLKEIQT